MCFFFKHIRHRPQQNGNCHLFIFEFEVSVNLSIVFVCFVFVYQRFRLYLISLAMFLRLRGPRSIGRSNGRKTFRVQARARGSGVIRRNFIADAANQLPPLRGDLLVSGHDVAVYVLFVTQT